MQYIRYTRTWKYSTSFLVCVRARVDLFVHEFQFLPSLNFYHAFRAGTRSGKPKEKVTITDCGLFDNDDSSNKSSPKALEGQQMRAGDGLLGNSFKDVQSTIDAQPPSEPWYKFW